MKNYKINFIAVSGKYSMPIVMRVICFALFMTFAGCSILSPVKVEPTKKYILSELPSNIPVSKKNNHRSLLVLTTASASMFDTPQMAYMVAPRQIEYFAKNEWAEPPAQLFNPLLIQTLQNTHSYRAIVTPIYVGNNDYVLGTELLELVQDFNYHPSIIRLRIRAELSRMTTGKVLAAKNFTVIEPVLGEQAPSGGVIAANHAIAKILKEIAIFCVNK